MCWHWLTVLCVDIDSTCSPWLTLLCVDIDSTCSHWLTLLCVDSDSTCSPWPTEPLSWCWITWHHVLTVNDDFLCWHWLMWFSLLTLTDVTPSTDFVWSDSSTEVILFTDVTPSIDVDKTPCVGAEWLYSLRRGWLTWFSVLTWNDVTLCADVGRCDCLCWRGMTLLCVLTLATWFSVLALRDLTPSLDFDNVTPFADFD